MPASIIAVWCPLLHCCIFLRYPVWCLLWHAGFGSIFLPPKLLHCASTSSCFQFGCGLQLGKGSWRSSALWHPAPCRAQWPAAAFRVLWQPLSIARLLTLAAAPHSVPCSRVQAPGVQLFLAQTYRQPLCRLRQVAKAAWCFWYQNNGIRIVELNLHHPEGRQLQGISCRT